MIIVVFDDGETWCELENCTIQYATAEDIKQLDEGVYPKFLKMATISLEEMFNDYIKED